MTTLTVKGHSKISTSVRGEELTFAVRTGTSDEAVVRQVVQPDGTLYANYHELTSVGWWIDIGANIGAFAGVARYFDRDVLCVEPNVFNLPLLMENTRGRSDMGSATYLPAAITQHDCLGVISGNGHLMHKRYDPKDGTRAWFNDPVPGVAMMRILWEIRNYKGDVGIKIDAEGAEWNIFDAMLRYGPPENLHLVVAEFHQNDPEGSLDRMHAILADMEINGFTATMIENSDPGLEPDGTQIVRFDRV